MSDESGDPQAPAGERPAAAEGDEAQRPECSACRGTGKVVSNLGGAPTEVECPWCNGDGLRLVEHDAQARQLAARGDETPQPTQGAEDPSAPTRLPEPTPEPPDQVA